MEDREDNEAGKPRGGRREHKERKGTQAGKAASTTSMCTLPSAAGEEDGDDTGPDSGGSVQV